jgi:hypothetical protein
MRKEKLEDFIYVFYCFSQEMTNALHTRTSAEPGKYNPPLSPKREEYWVREHIRVPSSAVRSKKKHYFYSQDMYR